MKFAALVAFCVLCAQSVPTLNAGSQMTNLFATTPVGRYARLPLVFEENRGQSNSAVMFTAREPGCLISLTKTGAILTISRASERRKEQLQVASSQPKNEASLLQLKLLGADTHTRVLGEEILPGKSNYFRGQNPKFWYTNIPQYAKVHYVNAYPGIDLVYYGNSSDLEWDFIVKPGANAQAIFLGVEGADEVGIEHGDLILTQQGSRIYLRRPHAYQQINGVKHDVDVRYKLDGKNVVSLELPKYDQSATLIIDPVLAYSTRVGSARTSSIAVDSAGNTYVTGTVSAGFENDDITVTKINADGTAIVYSTVFGGSASDFRPFLALGPGGSVVVTGTTLSTDFPVMNALQPSNHGGFDAFVAKINNKGDAFVYSTYLGGASLNLLVALQLIPREMHT